METSSVIVTSEVAPTLGKGPGVFAIEHIFRNGNATEGVPGWGCYNGMGRQAVEPYCAHGKLCASYHAITCTWSLRIAG